MKIVECGLGLGERGKPGTSSTIWEWARSRLEEAGRNTRGKGQYRKGEGKEQKREVGLLLPPTLFLALFFTYSFLTLHLCGWKIILDLTMKIPGTTKLWNSDSVSMAWESTFSIWALAGLQVRTSPEPSAGPVSGLVFLSLTSALPGWRPNHWAFQASGTAPTASKQRKRKGMIDYVKRLFLDFL